MVNGETVVVYAYTIDNVPLSDKKRSICNRADTPGLKSNIKTLAH